VPKPSDPDTVSNGQQLNLQCWSQLLMNTTSAPENTSEVPEGLNNWSWGGFFLNWIWGVFNGTWIALLCFTGVGAFIMPFVLGFKGREWAWKNCKWESVEHFNRVQKKWDFWGILIGVLSILVSGIVFAVTIFFAAQAPDAGISASSETVITSETSMPATSVIPPANQTVTPPAAQIVEPVAVPVQPAFDLSGVWTSSTTDEVTIVQNGNKLVGKYSYKGDKGAKIEGSFEAEIDGVNVVKGTWTEAPAKKPQEKTSGPTELKLSDDGSVLDGWYGSEDGTERSPWSLEKKQ
jgi:hypothetical protein